MKDIIGIKTVTPTPSELFGEATAVFTTTKKQSRQHHKQFLAGELITATAAAPKQQYNNGTLNSNNNSLAAAAVAAIKNDDTVSVDTQSVDSIIYEKVMTQSTGRLGLREEEEPNAFFVADLGEVVRQYRQFRRLLPRIEPFFAMKCNPDPMVIKTLIDMGTGFDCASKVKREGWE